MPSLDELLGNINFFQGMSMASCFQLTSGEYVNTNGSVPDDPNRPDENITPEDGVGIGDPRAHVYVRKKIHNGITYIEGWCGGGGGTGRLGYQSNWYDLCGEGGRYGAGASGNSWCMKEYEHLISPFLLHEPSDYVDTTTQFSKIIVTQDGITTAYENTYASKVPVFKLSETTATSITLVSGAGQYGSCSNEFQINHTKPPKPAQAISLLLPKYGEATDITGRKLINQFYMMGRFEGGIIYDSEPLDEDAQRLIQPIIGTGGSCARLVLGVRNTGYDVLFLGGGGGGSFYFNTANKNNTGKPNTRPPLGGSVDEIKTTDDSSILNITAKIEEKDAPSFGGLPNSLILQLEFIGVGQKSKRHSLTFDVTLMLIDGEVVRKTFTYGTMSYSDGSIDFSKSIDLNKEFSSYNLNFNDKIVKININITATPSITVYPGGASCSIIDKTSDTDKIIIEAGEFKRKLCAITDSFTLRDTVNITKEAIPFKEGELNIIDRLLTYDTYTVASTVIKKDYTVLINDTLLLEDRPMCNKIDNKWVDLIDTVSSNEFFVSMDIMSVKDYTVLITDTLLLEDSLIANRIANKWVTLTDKLSSNTLFASMDIMSVKPYLAQWFDETAIDNSFSTHKINNGDKTSQSSLGLGVKVTIEKL